MKIIDRIAEYVEKGIERVKEHNKNKFFGPAGEWSIPYIRSKKPEPQKPPKTKLPDQLPYPLPKTQHKPKIKTIIEQELEKCSSKKLTPTVIEIGEDEMEKVVKVTIDIGNNLKDVMENLIEESNYPANAIRDAFGPFLLECAKNIVLVLKENSEKEIK